MGFRYIKKKLLIFVILFITFLLYSKEYQDNLNGFKFKIPDNCILEQNEMKLINNSFYIKTIEMGEVDLKDDPIAKYKDIKDWFNKNIYNPIPEIGNYTVEKYQIIKSVKVSIGFFFGIDYPEGILAKRLSFFRGDKILIIELSYIFEGPHDVNDKGYNKKIEEEDKKNIKNIFGEIVKYYTKKLYNRNYTKDGTNEDVKIWAIIDSDIHKLIKGEKLEEPIEYPKEIIELYKKFDELVDSITFYNVLTVKYICKIPNLRFRETSGSDGKFIRMLSKGEKLELVEKGKEETVSGIKGNWVKVNTEKGEIGWCFDAYLEEVK